MKITTPEQELLELPKKTEEEQRRFLRVNKITSIRYPVECVQCGEDLSVHHKVEESLADLAERLWEKAFTKAYKKLLSTMLHVYSLQRAVSASESFFWMFEAKPINRIVAALIALQRAGVEL
jgi:hypothetical protein